MARKLCRDRTTAAIALTAACLLLGIRSPIAQLAVLAAGALVGLMWCRQLSLEGAHFAIAISSAAAWTALGMFACLLVTLPALALVFPHGAIALADIFYRAGALVFGGGHVVLPLLRDALIPTGWISDDRFLAGYGIAQAVPGPLFSFAAYVGRSTGDVQPPAWGACVALLSIFLPGMLVTIVGLAFWGRVVRQPTLRAASTGINAAVVGVMAAALYNPVWKTAVHGWIDLVIAALGLLLLARWRVAPIAVVALTVTCSVAAGLA